jgi:hypothetical protein
MDFLFLERFRSHKKRQPDILDGLDVPTKKDLLTTYANHRKLSEALRRTEEVTRLNQEMSTIQEKIKKISKK